MLVNKYTQLIIIEALLNQTLNLKELVLKAIKEFYALIAKMAIQEQVVSNV